MPKSINSTEFVEGRCAYLEDRPQSDNPYLLSRERGQFKDQWNTKAQEWDNGWCEEYTEENGEEARE